MALNGSVSVEATPKGQDLLVFSWSAVQDATANTSTVSWIMQLVASTAGAISGVPVERAWSVTVDGQEFTGTANVNIANNETKTLATGEIALEHNEDGTRSFDFAFSQDLSITWGASSGNPQFIGTVSGSGTGELDTIAEPEPEKFDIQGFMMGLAMALCGRAVQWPKREPVAYLYNGVRLPPLPDVEGHACIAAYTDEEGIPTYWAFITAEKFTCTTSGKLTGKKEGYKLVDSVWEQHTSFLPVETIWAGYDVYDVDGNLYREGSKPIPVYE